MDLKDKTNEKGKKVISFLDDLFDQIPTTVSKCWTKFNEYFQFWYELSLKGDVITEYLDRKEVIIYFLDYFLGKKSPLKLYQNLPKIGSEYADPNF